MKKIPKELRERLEAGSKFVIDMKKLKVGVMAQVDDTVYAYKKDDKTVEIWEKIFVVKM